MTFVYILVGLIAAWSVWGYFTSRVETAEYSVVESHAGYEVRLYPAHLEAQTTVAGSYNDALMEGFRILAGYIFGGNTKKEKIAMTAPVVEQAKASEPIAMTSPVLATMQGDTHTIAFGMPRSYTLETLPTPNDSRVHIVAVPEKQVAAIRFAWFRNDSRVQAKKQQLLASLEKDGKTVVGEPQYAGYNAPWTPPWMSRNEVLVEVTK